MSEVKGTLLTIILALSVFGIVFAIVNSSIQSKADQVSSQIEQAGGYVTPVAPAAGAGANALTYNF